MKKIVNNPSHKTLKVLDMMDCLDYLSELEANEKGTEVICGSSKYKNGEETIKNRLCNLIKQDQYGNQRFTNDCFYRWKDVAAETKDPDVVTFLNHFGDSVNHGKYEDDAFILFDVCW